MPVNLKTSLGWLMLVLWLSAPVERFTSGCVITNILTPEFELLEHWLLALSSVSKPPQYKTVCC